MLFCLIFGLVCSQSCIGVLQRLTVCHNI